MFRNKEEEENTVRRQRKLFTDLFKSLMDQQRTVLTAERVKSLKKIYVTGCGDSYFAALGSRFFFRDVTGMDVEPVESMEFSRYIAPLIRRVLHGEEASMGNEAAETMVLAVSNSGRVSRTLEALIQARKAGTFTVAMTGNRDRCLTAEPDGIIAGALPNIRSMLEKLSEPGVMERLPKMIGLETGIEMYLFMLGAYFGSLAHLYTAAIHIGEVRGLVSPDQRDEYVHLLLDAVENAVRTAGDTYHSVMEAAARFRDQKAFLFLGSGPGDAAAVLSAAKIFEQPHLNGVGQHTEEWAHLQLFYTRPGGVPVFLVVPPDGRRHGAGRDRAMEQIRGIRDLGGTAIVICSPDDHELSKAADCAIPDGDHCPSPSTHGHTEFRGRSWRWSSSTSTGSRKYLHRTVSGR